MKNIYTEQFDLECRFAKLTQFLQILKDAVGNNDDAYYLLDFIEIIQNDTAELMKKLDEYFLVSNAETISQVQEQKSPHC